MAVGKVKKEEVTSSLGQRINTEWNEINLAVREEGGEESQPRWIKWMARKGCADGGALVTRRPSVQPPAVCVLWVSLSTGITLIPLCLSRGSLQGWALTRTQPRAALMLAACCEVKHLAVLLTEAVHSAYCAKSASAGDASPECSLNSSTDKECGSHNRNKQCRAIFYLRWI